MKKLELGFIGSYTNQDNRYVLAFDNGKDLELHCGDCFEIEINGQFQRVRIELNSNGWYLTNNYKNFDMPGKRTRVRMEMY